jgi:hypothetical protein
VHQTAQIPASVTVWLNSCSLATTSVSMSLRTLSAPAGIRPVSTS